MDGDVGLVLEAAPEFGDRYLELVEAADGDPGAAAAFVELAEFVAALVAHIERYRPVLERCLTGVERVAESSEDAEERSSSFNVDAIGTGGACPATEPFDPGFVSGLTNTSAGAFSPFTLTFSRSDREQDLSSITLHTPPGLLAMLGQVPPCGEPHASAGACPPASQVGTSTVKFFASRSGRSIITNRSSLGTMRIT